MLTVIQCLIVAWAIGSDVSLVTESFFETVDGVAEHASDSINLHGLAGVVSSKPNLNQSGAVAKSRSLDHSA